MIRIKTLVLAGIFLLPSLYAEAVDLRYRAAVELNFSPALMPSVGSARGIGVGGELHVRNNLFVIADYSYSYYFSSSEDKAQTTLPDPYSYRDVSIGAGLRLYSHFSADSAYFDLGISRQELTAETRHEQGGFDSSNVDQNAILGGGLRFLWDAGVFVRLGGELKYRVRQRMSHEGKNSESSYSLTEQTFSSIELREQRHQFLLRSTLGYAF